VKNKLEKVKYPGIFLDSRRKTKKTSKEPVSYPRIETGTSEIGNHDVAA